MANFAAATRPARPAVPAWAWLLERPRSDRRVPGDQDNGAILRAGQAAWLHEVTHAARHALGVPCD